MTNANIMLEILNIILYGMRSDVPVFKVGEFASDFEFWIGVNEYYLLVVDILYNSNFSHRIAIHWSLFMV